MSDYSRRRPRSGTTDAAFGKHWQASQKTQLRPSGLVKISTTARVPGVERKCGRSLAGSLASFGFLTSGGRGPATVAEGGAVSVTASGAPALGVTTTEPEGGGVSAGAPMAMRPGSGCTAAGCTTTDGASATDAETGAGEVRGTATIAGGLPLRADLN